MLLNVAFNVYEGAREIMCSLGVALERSQKTACFVHVSPNAAARKDTFALKPHTMHSNVTTHALAPVNFMLNWARLCYTCVLSFTI